MLTQRFMSPGQLHADQAPPGTQKLPCLRDLLAEYIQPDV